MNYFLFSLIFFSSGIGTQALLGGGSRGRKGEMCPISMSEYGIRVGDMFLSASLLKRTSYITSGTVWFGEVKVLRFYFPKTIHEIIHIPDSCTGEQIIIACEDWLRSYS